MCMKKLTLLIALLSILSSTVSAWDRVGHRIVANIAYNFLTDAARQKVDGVLGYQKAMIYTSSWPDEIKSDAIYPESFVYHYQDLDGGRSRESIKYLYENKTSEGKHLYFAKDSLIRELKANPDNADALKFLVHFVGDEFQPMHAGHTEDVAGNRTYMTWFSTRTNLHAIWDRYLIEYSGYSSTEYTEYLINRYAAERASYEAMTELEAIYILYDLVEDIYSYTGELIAQKDAQDRLPKSYEYKYVYRYKDKLCQQLYIAGVQLAKALNDIYK